MTRPTPRHYSLLTARRIVNRNSGLFVSRERGLSSRCTLAASTASPTWSFPSIIRKTVLALGGTLLLDRLTPVAQPFKCVYARKRTPLTSRLRGVLQLG